MTAGNTEYHIISYRRP